MKLLLLITLIYILSFQDSYADESHYADKSPYADKSKYIVLFPLPDTKLSTCDGVSLSDKNKENEIIKFKEMSENYRITLTEKIRNIDDISLLNVEIHNENGIKYRCYLPAAMFFPNNKQAVDFCRRTGVNCNVDKYPDSKLSTEIVILKYPYDLMGGK